MKNKYLIGAAVAFSLLGATSVLAEEPHGGPPGGGEPHPGGGAPHGAPPAQPHGGPPAPAVHGAPPPAGGGQRGPFSRGGPSQPAYGGGSHTNVNVNVRVGGGGGQRPQYDRRAFPSEVRVDHHYQWRGGAWSPPRGYYAHHWGYGDHLPWGWFGAQWYINDYYDYGLPLPPFGYEWVRVGPDAVLVELATGLVVETAYGIFY